MLGLGSNESDVSNQDASRASSKNTFCNAWAFVGVSAVIKRMQSSKVLGLFLLCRWWFVCMHECVNGTQH